MFNQALGVCEQPPDDCRSPKRGNPVFVATGFKIQSFRDVEHRYFPVVRTYQQTSSGAVWQFSLLEKAISFTSNSQKLVLHTRDGNRKYLRKVNDTCWKSSGGNCQSVQFDIHGGLSINDGTIVKKFGKDGRILSTETIGVPQSLVSFSYSGNLGTLQNPAGQIQFELDGDKLTKIITGNQTLEYTYNGNGLLSYVSFPSGMSEYYKYSTGSKPLLIEYGINGLPFAHWEHNAAGKVVRSWHEGGLEEERFLYLDNEVVVTNPLGKNTRYVFQTVDGVRLVSSIHGEPSQHCAASNKEYEYYANGSIKSQTDWRGNLTTFVRDSQQREISRTEASGTPQARTILTEYHPTLNQPVKITEPGLITEMTYDAAGRLLNTQKTATAAP